MHVFCEHVRIHSNRKQYKCSFFIRQGQTRFFFLLVFNLFIRLNSSQNFYHISFVVYLRSIFIGCVASRFQRLIHVRLPKQLKATKKRPNVENHDILFALAASTSHVKNDRLGQSPDWPSSAADANLNFLFIYFLRIKSELTREPFR